MQLLMQNITIALYMSHPPRNTVADNHLVVTAMGKNVPENMDQLFRYLKESSCSISECRVSLLGGEMCGMLMLSGSWDTVAKIEDSIPRLATRLDMNISIQRTSLANLNGNLMPYAIDVIAFDRAGIVYDIVNFMCQNNIGIQDLHTNIYRANHTGTNMFSMHMAVNIPADISIASLRGDFMDFCDQLNLDAIMEPIK